jgi:hypothetical protein
MELGDKYHPGPCRLCMDRLWATKARVVLVARVWNGSQATRTTLVLVAHAWNLSHDILALICLFICLFIYFIIIIIIIEVTCSVLANLRPTPNPTKKLFYCI